MYFRAFGYLIIVPFLIVWCSDGEAAQVDSGLSIPPAEGRAPIKAALRAFSCRLGIESRTPTFAVLRRDWFPSATGGGGHALSSPTGIPHQMLLFGDSAARLTQLRSSIFVSKFNSMRTRGAAPPFYASSTRSRPEAKKAKAAPASPSGEGSSNFAIAECLGDRQRIICES
uniref:Secreted protein n=1 Tax=Macrostomum lignano TaxID=282301 RepID=A0A1I8FJF5_9PLAT